MSIMFMKENQTLYPASLDYNIALIMTELARIAENHGATVKYNGYNHGFIENRSIMEKIEENKQRAERLEELIKEGKTCSLFDNKKDFEKALPAMKNAISEYHAEIERLEAINNAPVEITHTSYISFVLDDVYYSYSMPDLIFDPALVTKTPVINRKGGKYYRTVYSTPDNKESWFYDCFWGIDCSKADIKEAANLIFNILMNSGYSEAYRETYRTRVPNRYNNGYHYETIEKPEQYRKIDFLTDQ